MFSNGRYQMTEETLLGSLQTLSELLFSHYHIIRKQLSLSMNMMSRLIKHFSMAIIKKWCSLSVRCLEKH